MNGYCYTPGDFQSSKEYLLKVCQRAVEADLNNNYVQMSKLFWLKPSNPPISNAAVYYRDDGFAEVTGALVWLYPQPDGSCAVQFNSAHHAIQTTCLDPEVVDALKEFAEIMHRWIICLQQQPIFSYVVPAETQA